MTSAVRIQPPHQENGHQLVFYAQGDQQGGKGQQQDQASFFVGLPIQVFLLFFGRQLLVDPGQFPGQVLCGVIWAAETQQIVDRHVQQGGDADQVIRIRDR